MVQKERLEDVCKYLEGLGLLEKPYYKQGAEASPHLKGLYHTSSKRLNGDLMNFSHSITRAVKSAAFTVSGYTATLTRIPEIEPNVFEGIDTFFLDHRLSKYNWDQDFKAIAGGSRRQIEAFNDLVLLSQLYNKKANDIANMLMLKHWAATPLERTIKIAPVPGLQTSLYFELNDNINDTNCWQAYHLLCGRAVLRYEQRGPNPVPGYWEKVTDGELDTFPLFDLAAQLRGLTLSWPLTDLLGQELVTELVNGGQPELDLKVGGKILRVLIEADPIRETLLVYTKDRQLLDLKIAGTQPGRQRVKKKPGANKP